MDPHISDATAASARIAGVAALRLELLQEAEQDRLALKQRPRLWPLVVAVLALVTALPVFVPVVRGSLQQSELRQEAEARHAEARRVVLSRSSATP